MVTTGSWKITELWGLYGPASGQSIPQRRYDGQGVADTDSGDQSLSRSQVIVVRVSSPLPFLVTGGFSTSLFPGNSKNR